MKIAIIQIDDSYEAPSGTIHLGTDGWVVDRPEKLIIRTNLDLPKFIEKVAEQNAGILGNGELVFAVFNPDGSDVISTGMTGMKEYHGRLLFSPEE